MTRPWVLHVALVVLLLLAGLAFVWSRTTNSTGFALAFGFFYLPFAVAYAVGSTVLALAFAAALPSRPRLAVVAAHPCALLLGFGALLLMARPG
ncbi:MAG: hypothetical protein SFW67_02695 [Myxococcaceae bacterium]|nr:hypothetical protein [Myxococcaceae bacterium]